MINVDEDGNSRNVITMGDIDEKADTYPPAKDQRNLHKLSTQLEKE